MYDGRQGVNGMLLNMSFMVHCHFEKGSKNQHFQSTILVGREGVTKTSTLCTLLIMWTILDDPLWLWFL